MSKATKWISAILFLILLGLLGAYAALRLPYDRARSEMPQGSTLCVDERADGSLLLRWEPSPSADDYALQVLAHTPDAAGQQKLLFSALCEEPRCVLPADLPEDQPLDLMICARKRYHTIDGDHVRMGEHPISVSCYLNRPKIENLRAQVDAESARTYLTWTGWQGDAYHLYLLGADGSRTLLRELRHVGAELQFGAYGELPIPAYGETVTFAVDGYREADGIIFYGARTETASVRREDFLGRTLTPECTEDGENCFTLTWNETKGERYEIRAVDPKTGEARVLAEVGADGERVYRTGHLGPFSTYTYEIAALGGEVIEGSDYAAPPVRVELTTRESPIYATVWALTDTDLYARPDGQEKTGTMYAARSYCVLAQENGYFLVGSPQQTGYVESGKCMIDLADYIGDLCSYDITNSYSSLYMVHEYGIPKVTDTVVDGYEGVALAPRGALVPLLYPTAQKLIAAAETMAADGYRIKIYDSFRPNRATRSIYDLTAKIMDEPIPEETFTGKEPDDLPEPKDEEEGLTYAEVMTGGGFGLGNFLAAGGSMHNLGVAMDLTMERTGDRAELPMQTSIHDLSQYSSIYRNNANANLLRQYMTAAGFGGLVSEWWHFQDNDAVAAYRPANRWLGVTAEGWRRDDVGWRYRLADGSYCRAEERTIDSVAYRFDKDGYMLTE